MMASKLTLLLLLAAGHSVHGEAGIDLVSFGDLYKLAQVRKGGGDKDLSRHFPLACKCLLLKSQFRTAKACGENKESGKYDYFGIFGITQN